MFQIAESGIILISIFADRPGEGGAWKSEPDKTYSKKKLGSRKHSDIVCLLEIRVSKKLVFLGDLIELNRLSLSVRTQDTL